PLIAFHDALRVLQARVDELPQEQALPALRDLAVVMSSLASRLIVSPGAAQERGGMPRGDRLLTVAQAAEKLGVTRSWVYRHAARLPFTVRLSPGRPRFSDLGIDEYIADRTA